MNYFNNNHRRRPSEEKPWLKYFSDEDLAVKLPNMSIYAYLKQCSQQRMDACAINYYGRRFSYRELFGGIEQTASAFAAWGVKKGETVSFLSVAVPETIFAIYALNKLGAVANLIDPRMGIDFIEQMIKGSDSRYLVCIDAAWPKVKALRERINQDKIFVQPFSRSLPSLKRLIVGLRAKSEVQYGDGIINWESFLAAARNVHTEEEAADGSEVAAIAYTGGTTGISKGVMFGNTSMNAVAFNFDYAGYVHEKGQSFLGIIPVFTSYGLVCGMHMPLCMGLELIPVPRFIPSEFGKLVRQFKPNHMISTPAFYELLMHSKEVRNMDLSFMFTLGTGGDTVNTGLYEQLSRFMKEHGIKYPLAQGYGLSEMSAAVSFCVNDIYKPGSVGIPSITTTVGIFDPDSGEELSYGEIGEVCTTGPSMMKAYYNQPEETAHIMRKHNDGRYWIHSGDLGYIDEDGFLFIKGRVKRMIIRFDGHKIYPLNIESMIAAHEKVHNCSVVGIPDRLHSQGEVPLVLVVIKDGYDKASVCRELQAECEQRFDERGQPAAILPLDALPLTGMGKIDCRALEREYADYDYRRWQE